MTSPIRILFFCFGHSIHARRRIEIFSNDPAFEVAVLSNYNYEFKNALNLDLSQAPHYRWLNIILSRINASRDSFPGWILTFLTLPWDILFVWKAVRKYRPDIIFHQTLCYPSYLGSLVPSPAKRVITFWNGDINWWTKWDGLERIAKKYIVQRAIKSASLVTVNALYTYKKCLEYGGRNNQVRILHYPGVDQNLFHPTDPKQARKELGLEAEKIIFMPRGHQMNCYLNNETILKALSSILINHSNILAIFAGTGSSQDKQNFEKLRQTLGIPAGQCKIISPISWNDMPLYYNASDVVVSLCSQDSMPNSILEAMACGKPVIAGDIEQLREIIVHRENGFLTATHDPVALANLLKTCLFESNTNVDFHARNLQLINQRYSQSKNTLLIRDWIQSLDHSSSPKKARILFVAMSESVHVARWIGQIANQGWELALFPSSREGDIHPSFRDITIHQLFYNSSTNSLFSKRHYSIRGIPIPSESLVRIARGALEKFVPNIHARRLAALIRSFKPDIVHVMEFQHAGYLMLDVAKLLGDKCPPWIVSNWGSDIYLFGRLSAHTGKIREILSTCSFYSCECQRDVSLAQEYGLSSPTLPVLPNSGGYDLEYVQRMRSSLPPSRRKSIVVKGYETWAGRALNSFRALRNCVDLLPGYTINVFSASESVCIEGELFSKETGIPVNILPGHCCHEEILRLHGNARISIGLSISDGISTSFLEALLMGSMPIQSNTSCAHEWAENGKTAFFVSPDDILGITEALRRALTDNGLVDQAAVANWMTAQARLDSSIIQKQILDFYQQALS